MKIAAGAFLALGLVACATTPTSQPRMIGPFLGVPSPPAHARSVEARRGWAIYQQMVAREIASEALPPQALADFSIAVVQPSEKGYIVRYTSHDRPVAHYDVEIPLGQAQRAHLKRHDPPIPLSPLEVGQWHAQVAWLSRLPALTTCAPVHQIVALKDEGGAEWLSYLIPIPDSPGFMQLGGFHVLRTDETGQRILEQQALNADCGGWRIASDARALVIAQRQTPKLTESDVYSSLLWDIVIFVKDIELNKVWAVDDAGISDVSDQFLKEGAAQPGAPADGSRPAGEPRR